MAVVPHRRTVVAFEPLAADEAAVASSARTNNITAAILPIIALNLFRPNLFSIDLFISRPACLPPLDGGDDLNFSNNSGPPSAKNVSIFPPTQP